ncbi:MAG TPA: hydrolase, partial [Gemmatales bacterium]|nr:hydrolase [Gemmatales bacterium]
HAALMSPADTGLLVIDVQEKLMPLIPRRAPIIANIAFLLEVAQIVNLPVQATEQYPRGLGPTVPALADKLPPRAEKVEFSCGAVRSVIETFHREARPKVLVVGIESHVCVMQTALDLLAEGFRVYIAADAVGSRHELDHKYALKRLAQAGAILTTVETAAFEWIGKAGTPEFKSLSRLVQERDRTMGS